MNLVLGAGLVGDRHTEFSGVQTGIANPNIALSDSVMAANGRRMDETPELTGIYSSSSDSTEQSGKSLG